MVKTKAEVWYRYHDPYVEGGAIWLQELFVVRRTPKGVVIDERGHERFVLDAGDGKGKRYCYPTVEMARDSYLIRKHRQIQHLTNQLNRARINLETMESGNIAPDGMQAFDLFA